MTIEAVREFFAVLNLEVPIIELEENTATVALAAEAHGVEPGRIAKTFAFRLRDGRVVLLVNLTPALVTYDLSSKQDHHYDPNPA